MKGALAFGSLLKIDGHLRNSPPKKRNPPEADNYGLRHTDAMLET
jgi:hypothetical protein